MKYEISCTFTFIVQSVIVILIITLCSGGCFPILHFCQYWIWWLLISDSTELLPHKLTQYVCTIIMSQCYDLYYYRGKSTGSVSW